MKKQIAIMAITENGSKLARKLVSIKDSGMETDLFLPEKLIRQPERPQQKIHTYKCSLREKVAEIFRDYDGLIFIMALGIVVRIIAPHLKDKREDPAVVTIDEKAEYVISTLSGHLGGANQLTGKLAMLLSARPVITTATEVQGRIAFEMLAREQNWGLRPFPSLKAANAAVVNGHRINIYLEHEQFRSVIIGLLKKELLINTRIYSLKKLQDYHKSREGFPLIISIRDLKLTFEHLQLIPKLLVVGIGCRRGISAERVAKAVRLGLQQHDLREEAIGKIATIDLKRKEQGINKYADSIDVPVGIVSRTEIKNLDLEYTSSDFVRKTIGVGGVCEPAAIISSNRGELILQKTSCQGVTVAIAFDNKGSEKQDENTENSYCRNT